WRDGRQPAAGAVVLVVPADRTGPDHAGGARAAAVVSGGHGGRGLRLRRARPLRGAGPAARRLALGRRAARGRGAVMIARRTFHRAAFLAAGLYNLGWGAYSALDPQWLFRL